MRIILLQFICFIVLCANLEANAQVQISGILIDDYTDTPIEGAKIKVKGINIGAFSDDKGGFSFSLNTEFPIVLFKLISGLFRFGNDSSRSSIRASSA